MLSIDENVQLNATEFYKALKVAEDFHGHLCPGMINGVKITLLAKQLLGYDELPNKDLIVIAEIDRCLTDAIMCITGCRPVV